MRTAEPRPDIPLPPTPVDAMLWAASAILVAAAFLLTLSALQTMPDKIPTHFGFTGAADEWGSKQTMWLFPAIGAVMCVLLNVLARFPRIFNYPVRITPENAQREYRIGRETLEWISAECCALFLLLEWQVIYAVRSGTMKLGGWVLPVFVAVILTTSIAQAVRMYRAR